MRKLKNNLTVPVIIYVFHFVIKSSSEMLYIQI